MPEIDTYSPRKVTPHNRDLLPSTHDPKKRTTYVQITLQEPEIIEAIRNYVRAQIPVGATDELPVDLIAGRGENGHSATIIVSAAPVVVKSPERPTEAMASFDEANADALRRNGDVDAKQETEAPQEEAPSGTEQAEEPAPSTPDTGEPGPEKAPEEAAEMTEDPPESKTDAPAENPPAEENASPAASESQTAEKSSIFENTAPTQAVPETPAEPQTEDPAPAQPAPKAKSIFDV